MMSLRSLFSPLYSTSFSESSSSCPRWTSFLRFFFSSFLIDHPSLTFSSSPASPPVSSPSSASPLSSVLLAFLQTHRFKLGRTRSPWQASFQCVSTIPLHAVSCPPIGCSIHQDYLGPGSEPAWHQLRFEVFDVDRFSSPSVNSSVGPQSRSCDFVWT